MDDKIINEIVWWIPFKKLRNSIRNYLNTINNIELQQNDIKKHSNIFVSQINDLKSQINNVKSEVNNVKSEVKKINLNFNQDQRRILGKESIKRAIELIIKYDNIDIKKKIFKENIMWVEIGISSYCNRKCWFCPNSIIDRHSKNIELREDLFLKLLSELRDIDYSNRICLHRYNEPLYDKELLVKRIKQVREYLPNSRILIFTNGDYINLEYLELLNNLSVNHIIIGYYYNYLDKNIPFDIERIIKPGISKIVNKLNLDFKVSSYNNIYYGVDAYYKSTYVEIKAVDFSKDGNDRGGVLKNDVKIINRTNQCFLPNVHMAVDYDANYTLCCNIRSDVEEHKKYILGNIEKDNIFDVYMSSKMIEFRKHLFLDGEKEGACAHCGDHRIWENFL